MRRLITTALLAGFVLLASPAWAKTPGPAAGTPPARKAATAAVKKPGAKPSPRKAIARRATSKAVQKAKAPARAAPAKKAVGRDSIVV